MYAISSLHHTSKREVIIAIPNAPPNVDPILKIPDATPTLSGSVVDTAVLNAGVANRPVLHQTVQKQSMLIQYIV